MNGILTNNSDVWNLTPGLTMRLVLVRHGEPEAAARGRCYGKLDVGLSERGRTQAGCAAVWLHNAPLKAIYTSPRRRARESGEIIARPHNLEVRVEEDLCEIDFGELEGLTYDEAAARYPQFYKEWMTRPTEVTFPGGESFLLMRQRVMRVLRNICAKHNGQTIALVTHGGVNRIVFADALRIAPQDIFRLDQEYAAISIVDYYDKTPLVRLVNRWY